MQDVTPCSLVEFYVSFVASHCLNLKNRSVSRETRRKREKIGLMIDLGDGSSIFFRNAVIRLRHIKEDSVFSLWDSLHTFFCGSLLSEGTCCSVGG
jgi:hypothetical protein